MAEPKTHRGRRSLRVSSYDYAAAGWYYITICVHNRRCIFGSIKDGEMLLNRAGGIARDEWLRSLELRPGLEFDQWVIMPNHLHAIVVLPTGTSQAAGAHSCAPLQRKPRSLASFVAQYKAAVTRRLRWAGMLRQPKLWQRNYFEHIIRTERALDALREYIYYNPLKWELDKLNPKASHSEQRDEADSIIDRDAKSPRH